METDRRREWKPSVGGWFAGCRIDCVLGEGGSAVVLGATRNGEPVALKVPRPEDADFGHVQRFRREGRILASLQGNGAPRLLDAGALADGMPYLVLERLIGSDLGRMLAERGPVAWPVAARYLMEACGGLAESHRLGVWHRDLKPSNLFLCNGADGVASIKILDFGLAGSSCEEDSIDDAGMVMGTPSYMPPEQFRGLAGTDGRSDVWSLGATLFELLTGRLPFDGASLAVTAQAVLTEAPAQLQAHELVIPTGLEELVRRCLSKDPGARPQSASELSSALRPYACARALRRADPTLIDTTRSRDGFELTSSEATYGGMMPAALATSRNHQLVTRPLSGLVSGQPRRMVQAA